MERTLSPEEKIRRAEEIYKRRQNQYPKTRVATVNVTETKSFGLFKRMILQILICFVIYFIFYLVQNGNYVFSEDVINKTKEILSYDINIPSVYEQASKWVQEQMQGLTPNPQKEEESDKENTVEQNVVSQDSKEENGIGGADLEDVVMEDTVVAGVETQEPNNEPEVPQTDDEYLKTHFAWIKPINGIISSEFGLRDSSNPIVSKNHTGLDIAANTGTVIVAAIGGTVTVSSTTGDYGYHIKIVKDDVTTLYGHCSKLYVKQGEIVEQGQAIAEVGSTGKSTGPHLHFEIMRGSTYINPRNILDF